VLVRSDGRPTYFANDIAYHVGKYERGFDRIINIWGSNHHGHIPRMKASLQALGYDPAKLETVLYQYVRVKRGNEAVKMSKRGGNFVTAKEVLDEVGKDAFRFFLLTRAPESHLDFDLELAKKQSHDNPVYYVQYAHARIASIFRKWEEQGGLPLAYENADLSRLELPEEIRLIRLLHEYPDEVALAARRLEPHRIPFYLLELTRLFQAYYTKAREDPRYRVIGDLSRGDSSRRSDIDTTRSKLYLCANLKRTIAGAWKLIGVSAPEAMQGTHE
jgi:arginyl-tRNA synthetase